MFLLRLNWVPLIRPSFNKDHFFGPSGAGLPLTQDIKIP